MSAFGGINNVLFVNGPDAEDGLHPMINPLPVT